MEKETVYYWDINDNELTEKRKKDLKLGYVATITILGVYSFVCIPNLLQLLKDDRFIFILLLYLAALIGGFIGLRYNFIKDQKAALSNGIKLTSNELRVYCYNYPLSTILYSEVVYFFDCGEFMALIYLKKGKKKIKLFRSEKTEDIRKLSNLIRELKGLPEQRKVKSYGRFKGYDRWKKEVMEKLNLE